MKILCFIDNLGSGGAQRQLVMIGCLLQKKGYEVEFLTYGKQRFMAEPLVLAGIQIFNVEARSAIGRIWKCYRYLKNRHPDVVISFLDTPNFCACCARILGVKMRLLLNERSAYPQEQLSMKLRFFRFVAAHSGDRIICNSLNAKKIWCSSFKTFTHKICTIYNPIVCGSSAIKKNTFHTKIRRLVVAASFQYQKNPIGLIDALRKLTDDERRRLHIDWFGKQEVTVGNCKPYEDACQRIKEYQLADTITLHPECKTIYTEMQNSDAVGLFSYVEGMPNTILEGLMLGKPIIMSRVSDYDVITDSACAFLCDAENSDSIAEALRCFLATSSEKIMEMGLHASEKANELFAPKHIIQQWVDEIEGKNDV